MKQVSVVISTYTSDVSGVCSALYELGGMVVIHDPSGCNSTYNTHDEPRWFDQDSLIFISGLSQMDAVMGNDDKFIEDVLRAAEELEPRFIALVRSPIPLMIGTDFDGIATEIEARCGIPTFFIPTTGMKSYVKGAGMALETMVREFMPDPADFLEYTGENKTENTIENKIEKEGKDAHSLKINILGATPLDFSINGTYESMKEYLVQNGLTIQGSLAYQTDFEEMLCLHQAGVNLVVTASGLPAARAMEEIYGIPYVIGFPTGAMGPVVVEALQEAARDQKNINTLKIKESMEVQKQGILIHEPVIAASLAKSLSISMGSKGLQIQPVSMVETENIFQESGVRWIGSEEEMQNLMKEASFVVADPMFQPISPEGIPFYPLIHEAFSGRTYRRDILDLMKMSDDCDYL